MYRPWWNDAIYSRAAGNLGRVPRSRLTIAGSGSRKKDIHRIYSDSTRHLSIAILVLYTKPMSSSYSHTIKRFFIRYQDKTRCWLFPSRPRSSSSSLTFNIRRVFDSLMKAQGALAETIRKTFAQGSRRLNKCNTCQGRYTFVNLVRTTWAFRRVK